MGRYNVGKCDELSGIDIRAPAETPTMPPTAAVGIKLRKVSASSASTTPYSGHQLSSRRRRTITSENSASDATFLTETTTAEVTTTTTGTVLRNCEDVADCYSGGEVVVSGNSDDFAASCCSSNVGSPSSEGEIVKECTATTTTSEIVADPEVQNGETSSRFGELCEAPSRVSDGYQEPGVMTPTKSTVQIKMPSESEMEDFFSAAENELQKRFSDKYNFDIVKDVPLEGRYEWVQIKP